MKFIKVSTLKTGEAVLVNASKIDRVTALKKVAGCHITCGYEHVNCRESLVQLEIMLMDNGACICSTAQEGRKV